jgi:hypothetical protein
MKHNLFAAEPTGKNTFRFREPAAARGATAFGIREAVAANV